MQEKKCLQAKFESRQHQKFFNFYLSSDGMYVHAGQILRKQRKLLISIFGLIVSFHQVWAKTNKKTTTQFEVVQGHPCQGVEIETTYTHTQYKEKYRQQSPNRFYSESIKQWLEFPIVGDFALCNRRKFTNVKHINNFENKSKMRQKSKTSKALVATKSLVQGEWKQYSIYCLKTFRFNRGAKVFPFLLLLLFPMAIESNSWFLDKPANTVHVFHGKFHSFVAKHHLFWRCLHVTSQYQQNVCCVCVFYYTCPLSPMRPFRTQVVPRRIRLI